jgi:RluA family pseudouridine synthase
MTEQLVKLYPQIKTVGDAESRAGIVHRLDREASGLLVVAKTSAMFAALKKQFQNRTVEKEYTVLVHGVIETDHGEINFVLDRGSEGRMASRPKVDLLTLHGVRNEQPGKDSLTEFWVEKRFVRYTLLRVKIHTGRMHQIRAHMLAYGHPVVGDMLYFNKKLNRRRDLALGRLWLHATRLCFVDLAGKKVCYDDPLPKELQDFLIGLR